MLKDKVGPYKEPVSKTTRTARVKSTKPKKPVLQKHPYVKPEEAKPTTNTLYEKILAD